MSFEKKRKTFIGATLKASASQNKTIFVNFTKTMESFFFKSAENKNKIKNQKGINVSPTGPVPIRG